MLQFVLGRAGSGKTEYMRRLLADRVASRKADRSLSGDGGFVMIVPEQYSFETEKAMLRLTGPERANAIQVYSFTRLAETLFRKEGGAAGRRLADSGRRILMSAAIAACEDNLEIYQNAAKSGRITDIMLTAVNEMKMCGIAPAALSETSERLGKTGLSKKLSELSLLYSTYEALVESSYLDSRDDLTRLAEALEQSEFFKNCTVTVDSFEGFTVQETRVLARIMQKADNVIISLCTDGVGDDTGLFALVDRTRRRLTRVAEENGVKLLPPVYLTGAPRFKNENLKLLENQLFCADERLTSPDCEGIAVFEAKDVFEEAEFVAATIRRLISEKNIRYRDVSVICRSPDRYYGSLDVAFKKRDIPCFVSQPDRVDAEPVMRFALGAFEAVQSYSTESLLEMLKTGVSGFSETEISELENYAFLWRINGSAWKEEFVRHPRGFGREFTDEDRENLALINSLRERLITPLLRFGAETKDASGEKICEALYNLLLAYGMEETVPAYCVALEAAGEDALAAKQLRVWALLMEILDQMRSILGERHTTRERFYKLLKEVVSAEDVSEIPETVDEVIFGAAEQVRQSSPKVAFLIGAVQGEFPLTPRSSGVFSDAERRELIELDLPLGDPLEQKTIEERYLAYSVACAPSEMLYVSYPRTADGEKKEESELVRGVLDIFPTLTPLKDLPTEYFANSHEAAFSRMAASYTDTSAEASTLRALFENDADSVGKIEALERAARKKPAEIEDKALARKLFGERLFFSPTQVEEYHKCAFKYFCRYGLNARERRPAEVDVMQYGSLMHYLFEKVFSEPQEDRSVRREEELFELVKELIERYAEENMGGMELLSSRERYRLDRLATSAVKLILHIEEELSQSKFKPEHFELQLGRGKFPPLKIECDDGRVVIVGGTIDRVDTYKDSSGSTFVRVIDYKTGGKEFRLADVLYGLNMQMLVYLAALVESGQEFPAGILYVPSAEPSVPAERGSRDEKIKAEADKQMRMKGVVLDDAEIIRAMEAGASGRFIPASLNKDGSCGRFSSVLSENELKDVLEYSKRLIAAMGAGLTRGVVAAKPNLKNSSACEWCRYSAVCGTEYTERDVEKYKPSSEEVMAQMRAALYGENAQEGGGENG